MSRRRQPHRIPPPISHGAETLDAEIILQEIPDDVGLYLWKTARTVRLWGELTPEQRSAAFAHDAYTRRLEGLRALQMSEDLRESLETAAVVLRGEEVHLEAVVTACRLIASWADERGALGTALEFTQAAALLLPTDAELVHTVAWLARRRGEYARAESWYRQSIGVARRSHDWISLAGSYLGLGATFLERGSHASARQTLVRGIRAATRHSLWEERALLSHELARVAMRTERPPEVVRSGRAAFEAYGPNHPRLPKLATDLGVFWIRSGHAAEGQRVLLAVDVNTLDRSERLSRAAALVRAAGETGDAAGFDAAWDEAAAMLRDPGGNGEAVLALLDLAHGAAAAGARERLRKVVERASRAAELRGDSASRQQAEALLRSTEGDPPHSPEPTRNPPRELRRLADDLTAAFTTSAEAA